MGIFKRLFGAPEPAATPKASLENPATSLSDPAAWFTDWALAGAQKYGPAITPHNAMTVSAVYRAVTLRAGVVAGLPLKLYRRTETGREEAPNHKLARLLRMAPYPGRPMTAHVWIERMMREVDLFGNSYAAVRFDNAARVIGLEPFCADKVEVQHVNGRTLYTVTHDDGRREVIDQNDVLHFVGPNTDGIKGISPITAYAKDSIALAKALEDSTGFAHENAARPSGVVELPPSITPEGLARMKAAHRALSQGRGNEAGLFYVDQGSKFTPVRLSPADLATIESRRYSVAEVARWYGVPLTLLQETDKSTSWGSGIAEQNLGWLCYSLNADLSRIENEINYKLLDGSEFYVEFHRSALLEMDPLKAAQVGQTEVSFGGMTPNEYRQMKNRPPVEGGELAFRNSTNVPLDTPAPAPAPNGGTPNE